MRQQRGPLVFWAFICLITACLAGLAQADDAYRDTRSKYAAVVSMGAYKNTKPLKNPPNDAKLLATRLTAAGFKVSEIADAPLTDLKARLASFFDQAKASDVILVYYAGHAVQIDGENYLAPVDFDTRSADLLGSLYPVKALLDGLNVTDKARVLLLDACRDNPFQEALKAQLGGRASGQGLAAIQIPDKAGTSTPSGTTGLVIGYATQPQFVAFDGKGANSRYAEALGDVLQSPESDFASLLVKAANRVRATTLGKQRPEARVALNGPLYLVSRAKPYECDVLAAEPDNDVSVAGVEFEEIDAAKALPACEADLAKNPDSPRLIHNYAKTLERSGKLNEAVAQYRKSAELGYDWAQVYLATAYMEGTGVAPDMKEGVDWLRKSFEQGNRQALVTYTELDLARAFDNKPVRVNLLQKALRDAGETSVQDTESIDDATSVALGNFMTAQGLEGKAITFQVLDRLGIVEALWPKKE